MSNSGSATVQQSRHRRKRHAFFSLALEADRGLNMAGLYHHIAGSGSSKHRRRRPANVLERCSLLSRIIVSPVCLPDQSNITDKLPERPPQRRFLHHTFPCWTGSHRAHLRMLRRRRNCMRSSSQSCGMTTSSPTPSRYRPSSLPYPFMRRPPG